MYVSFYAGSRIKHIQTAIEVGALRFHLNIPTMLTDSASR